jgi:hypothetical protein
MSSRENSVTSLVADYLRNNGMNVNTFEGIEIPGQGIKEPDYTVRNDGRFLGEAKWESEYSEGLVEAHDYNLAAQTNGTFVIGYPDQLKQEIKQSRLGNGVESVLQGHEYRVAFLHKARPTDMSRISIEELPEWLQGHSKGELTPHVDPEEVITVLQQTAEALTQQMESLQAMELFRNVLGVDAEEEQEKVKSARRLTGYLLVNQITFYRVLSAVSTYEDIDPTELGSPSDLTDYFEHVLEDDYTPIFSFPVAEAYEQKHLPLIRDAVKKIYALNPDQINHEVLGDIFHQLIPFSLRKSVAAFYTKNKAAKIIADIAVDDGNDTVLDPACGSGTLLTAAYRRKKAEYLDWNEEIHKRFLEEEITGLDIMPFAAHLSTIHLALQQPQYPTDEVRVGIEDSTKIQPGDEIQPLSHMLPENLIQRTLGNFDKSIEDYSEDELVERGSIHRKGMIQQPLQLEEVDLVMMNPPYSRQESIASFDSEYKTKLKNNRLRQYEQYINGLMSFYSYFFLIADRFLNSGGRVAAVVPHTILNKSTDSGIRELLTEDYNIEYLFIRDDETNFSEDTEFREIMLIAEKGHEEHQKTNYIRLQNLDADPGQIVNVCESLDIGETAERNDFRVQNVDTGTLNPQNLFTPFAVFNPGLLKTWEDIIDSDKITELRNLDSGRIGGVRGGADDARGYNPQMAINAKDVYNIKDSDSWILNRESESTVVAEQQHTGDGVNIPRGCLVPNLRGFSGRSKVDVSDLSEYAVIDRFNDFDFFESLTDVEEIPVEDWRKKVESRVAHLALVRRANLTAPGLQHMVYYSEKKRLGPNIMWMLSDLNQKEAKALAAWFDSTIGWLQFLLDRVETEGAFGAWRGYIVKHFKAPNLYSINQDNLQLLLDGFEEVRDVETGSLVEQLAANVDEGSMNKSDLRRFNRVYPDVELGVGLEERRELDTNILEFLNVPEDERDEILDDMYENMLMELVLKKDIM